MTTLTGSTKQIEWAGRIRAAAMPTLASLRAMVAAAADRDPKMAETVMAIIDDVTAKADASWWIDARELIADERAIKASISMAAHRGRRTL